MSISTPRRYYLLSRRAAAAAGDYELASVWRYKQEALAWPPLPSTFPARAKLVAAFYTTVRDLDSADETELRGIGLTHSESAAVIAAMEDWPMTIALVLKTYTGQDGRARTVYDVPLVPSAVRTATFTSDTIELGDLNTLRLTLAITAASGTNPTLNMAVQVSPNGADGWRTVFNYGEKTTTGSDPQSFSNLDRFVRAVATIAGSSPSFTMSLLGEAC